MEILNGRCNIQDWVALMAQPNESKDRITIQFDRTRDIAKHNWFFLTKFDQKGTRESLHPSIMRSIN